MFAKAIIRNGLCTFKGTCILPDCMPSTRISFSPAVCLLVFLFHLSCNTKKDEPVLFELMNHTGINFENKVKDGALENSFLFRNFYNGGGVAIGDINNDGLADILLTSNMGENKLYLNKGNFQFQDITQSSGMRQDSLWNTGVVFADVNNDGWLDMYVCSSGHMSTGRRKNKLYINNHNLTFTEEAAKYGLDIAAYTTQVSFFDYDLDGDLDCFMINNSPIPVNTLNNANRRDLPEAQWPVAAFLKGGGDHLFRNDNGHYTEVTKDAGIHGSLISFGLGVMVGDINNDGYPDVFVSNDSYERDYLYINQKNGTFKDELENWMQHLSMSSMGADLADINNDGYPDLVTTDMLPDDDYRLKTTGSFDNIDLFRGKLRSTFYYQYVQNCLQLNNHNGKLLDIANYAGVNASDWSWGALLFDADNDGYNDLYVCNGVSKDVTNLDFLDFFANDINQKMVLTGKKEGVEKVLEKIPETPLLNKAFRNAGGNLSFEDMGRKWGFTQPSFSNGAAYGDLDNDGDLDLVINNINQPSFIYKNNSREQNKNNYISLLLKGRDANTFAIGSKIRIYAGHQQFYRELMPSRGFQSSVDYKQVIGLGQVAKLDSMTITWPNGAVTVFQQPGINQLHTLQQPAAVKQPAPAPAVKPALANPMFTAMTAPFEKHQEDDYVDFYYERNLPSMLSREGPKAATGDVNSDGLPDVYIGGTPNHPGQLYLQTAGGGFVKKEVPVFKQFLEFEDEAVLFFDADGDGDLDLFVGPGGNSAPPYSRLMQNRLFKNDGKGNFTLDAAAFPENGMNTGVAVACDFNGDGKTDLFVGGRSVPRDYGVSPSSFLYVNDGNGHFTDIAKKDCPAIATIGMVTGASWVNVAGDSAKELVIVGEWMAPRIFACSNNHFTEIKSNLNSLSGWWQTIATTDVNNDGKTDLVLGNIGENFYLRPDQTHPVKLWLNDFDQNGFPDLLLSRSIDGKNRTVFLKHEMEDAVPLLKKQNLRHAEFAKKTAEELFPKEKMDQSVVKEFNYAPSVVAINKGNGQFDIVKLPVMIQLSSVNAIQCIDVNLDGHMDIVTGGNRNVFLPQFGRLDASFGDVLLNDGSGHFTVAEHSESGIQVQGEVRDIAALPGKNRNCLLFLRNDDYPVLYELNTKKVIGKRL